MPVSDERPKGYPVEVYCDETLDRGGYDILGGLWFTRPQAIRMREKIQGIRDRHGIHGEFKWVKSSGRTLNPAYRELGELLMNQLLGSKGGGFNCIIIRKALLDFEQYHGGDRELAFYKFWHLLFRKRIEAGASYLVHLDRRTDRVETRLSDLRDVLNNCGRKDHSLAYDCCRDVIPVDSKDDDLVQATDLLLGAVGYHRSGAHEKGSTSPAKRELAERMATILKRPLLCTPTRASAKRFNVWLWRPRLG